MMNIEKKIRELREMMALIEEAQAEAETLRDEIKAFMGDSEELRERFTKTTTTRRFHVA